MKYDYSCFYKFFHGFYSAFTQVARYYLHQSSIEQLHENHEIITRPLGMTFVVHGARVALENEVGHGFVYII